jgi:hypothetical protein
MLLRSLRLFLSSWKQGLRVRPVWTVGALLLVVCAEVFGRQSTSDVADLVWVLGGCLFLVFVSSAHQEQPIPWWGVLKEARSWIGRKLKSAFVEIGVDFRGEPAYAHGWPPVLLRAVVGLMLLCGVIALLGTHAPGGLRWLGVHGSFAIYLIVLALLWFAHAAVLFGMGWGLLSLTREFANSGQQEPDAAPPRWRSIAGRLLVLATFAGALLAPPLIAILILIGTLVLHSLFTLLPGRPTLSLIWRPSPDEPPRCMPWETFLVLQHTLITLCVLAVVLSSRAPDLWGLEHPIAEMPVTRLLGRLTAWLGAGGVCALTGYALHVSYIARRRNTEAPVAPALFLEGEVTADDVQQVAASAALDGWSVRAHPARRRRGEVRMRLVEEVDPFGPGNTLGRSELDDPSTTERLARRDQITQRRYLMRALKRLFKHAAQFKFKKGTGFLVVPHVWFVSGLGRDEEDEEESDDPDRGVLDGPIGPRFDRLIPMAARHHLWIVLRALDVDALFVEDGVRWDRLRPVLKRLFEIYDRNDGARRAEERLFAGIPKTRVVIHELSPESPFEQKGYPEPKYRGLGRARVLHVFKDRGGEEELTPVDAPSELVPVLV